MKKSKKALPILLFIALLITTVSIPYGGSAQAAKKVSISQKTLSLNVGKSKKLTLKNLPKNQKVQWASSNKKVATVSATGKVTAKKVGKATITATVDKKKYICNVTVKKKSASEPASEPASTPEPDDPTDGDVYYTTPSDYRALQDDVTYGEIKITSYYSTTTGKDRKLIVVLPPNYTTDKQYPVCYLLHGLGQDNSDWLNAGARTIVGNMIAAGTAREMILVLPNCRARENDAPNPPDAFALTNYQAFDNFINDLRDNVMPFVKENFSIKEGRENTAIAGFSMGGRTALQIGLTMQDTFGYTGGFCPAPGIFAYSANGVTEDGLFTRETFKLNDEYADNTLIMIVAGKSDNMVGGHPASYHNALEANGTKHIWYRKAGGHDLNVMDNSLYNFAKLIFPAE